MNAQNGRLVARFRAARRDPALVVIEGFHALKHALRFGAEILEAVSRDPETAIDLARRLAPDVAPSLAALLVPVPAALFAELAPRPPETGVLALARRPDVDGMRCLRAGVGPLVLLDRPAHARNLGAAVRVAAAAGADALLTLGPLDPWHPTAVRAGAGLQFALPVARIAELGEVGRPIVALDPEGDLLEPARIADDAILAFGSERQGLSPGLLARADRRVRLPMRPGVSSLNLATAVAAVLYLQRLRQGENGR